MQLIWDHRTANLTDGDRLLCDYAVKLTLAPGAMNERDVQHLRDGSFSDEQVSIATQVISYFNYINRIADGLGVDDEAGMTPTRDEWFAGKGRGYAVQAPFD